MIVYKKQATNILFLVSCCFLFLNGCALFDLFTTGPMFSVSGAKVAVMPFAGPAGNSWYGDNTVARTIESHTCSLLKKGGAELTFNNKIRNEIVNYTGNNEPDWVYYGSLMKVDYVVVGRLEEWEIGNSKAIGFCPGKASIEIEVYSVKDKKICFQKREDDIRVGDSENSTEFYYNKSTTERALLKKTDERIAKIFVGSNNMLD